MKEGITRILESINISSLEAPERKALGGIERSRLLEILILVAMVAALTICGLGFFFDQQIGFLAVAIIVVGLLFMTYLMQTRYIREHNAYEEKLHAMACTLEERNRELKKLIMIDPLTQLLNRRGLDKVLVSEMNRAKRKGSKNIALMIDCDDFKGVNEKYGHAAGDAVLVEIATRAKDAVRPSDHAARIGGDEFMILLCDLELHTAVEIAERVRMAIADSPVLVSDRSAPVTTSISVAELSEEVCSIEEILAAAAAGLKHSKRAGKNTVTSIVTQTAESSSDKMEMLLDKLRSGENLETFCSPIVRLDDQVVLGYEFECRGPKGPFEKQEAFYRLAAERKMLTTVDLQCLKQSLKDLTGFPNNFCYFIKLLPSTILDLNEEKIQLLFKERAEDMKVCIEIDETQFFGEPSCLIAQVELLKETGVSLAIAGVGSGFSSLESLLLLDPSYLKLDEKFCRRISSSLEVRNMASKILMLAGQINTEVIASGIESEEDLSLLTQLGFKKGQGALLGLPLPTEVQREQLATPQ